MRYNLLIISREHCCAVSQTHFQLFASKNHHCEPPLVLELQDLTPRLLKDQTRIHQRSEDATFPICILCYILTYLFILYFE